MPTLEQIEVRLAGLDSRLTALEAQAKIAPAKSSGGSKYAWEAGERRRVNGRFKDTLHVLSKNPACKEDWKKSLTELLRYDEIYESKWKFFLMVHRNVLGGNWPDWSEFDGSNESISDPSKPLDPDYVPF